MKRNHIHFASGLPGIDGVISGMQSSCEIFIFVNGSCCTSDEIPFFVSENGVILTAGIGGILSPVYFLKVIGASTKETLFKGEKDEVVK